jgi:cell division protein FtsQ
LFLSPFFRMLKIKKYLFIAAGLLVVVLIIAFSTDTFSSRICRSVEIDIKNGNEQFFVNQDNILSLATNQGTDVLKGKYFESINLRQIEKRILRNRQIKTCHVYKDLQGHLNIDVEQYLPIARIMKPNGEQMYVDKDGTFFPLSSNYSSRVIILSGNYFSERNAIKGEKNKKLMEFINQVNEDDFWKAQFTQFDIDFDQDISIVPLLGKHLIEFGKPEEIDKKLNKLMIFYKQILPVKGWDAFNRVSVKFANQIVCE